MSIWRRIAEELLDLPTPEEMARQERIVTEIPKEKPPICYEDGNTIARVYVGRNRREIRQEDMP